MTAAATTATAGASSQTLLGLFDGYMSLKCNELTSETKLGGIPVYFPTLSSEQQTDIAKWTTCGVCGHRMYLLLQAYSPLPSMEALGKEWNRMLYVFCCNSASCARQPSSSWCAFSVQVDQEDTAAALDDHEDSSSVGGADAEGGERPLSAKELPASTFPPCYVFVDEEPAKEVIVPTDLEREMAKMAEANALVDGNGIRDEDLQELERYVDLKDKKSDYYYEKFRSRLARAPNQVLRYHQRPVPSLAGNHPALSSQERPLFMHPDKVKRFLSVPACAYCGAVLVHELQLMPTTLFYLHVSQYVDRKKGKSGDDGKTAPATSLGSATSAGSSSLAGSDGDSKGSEGGSPLLSSGRAAALRGSSGDDGVDFGTATVYVCSRDCAMYAEAKDAQGKHVPGAAMRSGVYVRREVIMVEEPPSLRDDRLEAEQEGGRRDLRRILEDEEASAGGGTG